MSSYLSVRTYYESKSFISSLQSLNFEMRNELSGILWQSLNESQDFNPLTPNDHYSGRTASLTSKRCILCTYSTNTGTEYLKHGT